MKNLKLKLIFGLLALLMCVSFSACKNPIMEKWWHEENIVFIPSSSSSRPADYAVVVFDSNGGTPQPKSIRTAYDVPIGRLLPMTRGDYGFVGWFTERDELWNVETRAVTKNDVNNEGVLLLIAKWASSPGTPPDDHPTHPIVGPPVELPVYKVTFDSGIESASVIDPQLIAQGGKVVSPVVPSAIGYGFDGWAVNSPSGPLWNFNDPVNANMTLYAIWHTDFRVVRFEPNGGTRPDGATVLTHEFTVSIVNGIVPHPGPLIRPGHFFGGWYADPIYNGDPWDFEKDHVTTGGLASEPLILYARWIPQTRTIIFVQNGGTGVSPNTFEYAAGSRINNPGAPTRQGFTFLGWFHDPLCTPGTGLRFYDYTVPAPDGITDLEPIYFYASWKPTEYLVTFNVSESQLTAQNQLVQHGNLIDNKPAIPPERIPSGSWFSGIWYKDPACTPGNEWNFDNDRVTVNTDLHARLDWPGYTVTFVLESPVNGLPPTGTAGFTAPPAQYVLVDHKVIEPFMPALPPPPLGSNETRYSFLRWDKADGTPWDFENDLVTATPGNITLYARWAPPIPDMIWVPRGSFIMGDSGVSGSPAMYHAYPTRRVTLDGFYISRYEIAQENKIAVDDTYVPNGLPGYKEFRSNPSQFTGTRTRPVEQVTWDDAMAYCEWLNSIYGLPSHNRNMTEAWAVNGFRLPTEAEWEYAARGGPFWTENLRYAGSDTPELVAWYNTTVAGEPLGFRATQTVGRKIPNQLGIYDMSGNVSEWCYDWFASYGNLTGPGVNGTGPNPIGPASGSEKVRRGGAWNNAAGNVRSVVRNSENPNNAHWAVGFRVVRGPVTIW